MKDSEQARSVAEAKFRKKEQQMVDGQKAMAEYNAKRRTEREKTARLRALRLARDAAVVAAVEG